MKRLIVCETCRKALRALYRSDTPYPGEHVKFVGGDTLEDFICDHCDARLPKGTKACAVSMWADHGRVPHFPWEHECLVVSEE